MTEIKAKELTFATIKKEAKKVNESVQYKLNDTTYITYNPVFSQTKLQEMFEFIIKVLKTDELDLKDADFLNLVHLNMIKFFTSIGKQLKGATLVEQLNELNSIVDTEIDGVSVFKVIIEQVFDPNQITKVHEQIAEKLAELEVVNRITQEQLVKMAELNVINEEIRNLK